MAQEALSVSKTMKLAGSGSYLSSGNCLMRNVVLGTQLNFYKATEQAWPCRFFSFLVVTGWQAEVKQTWF